MAKKDPGIVKDFEWNLGEKDKKGLVRKIEKAIVIGIIPASNKEAEVMEHLDELEFLAETAGVESIKRFTQRLEQPNTLTYLGKGKLEEVGQYIASHEEVTVAIFDDDLSPKQLHAIEEVFKVKVLDRSGLILDIFAQRAKTAQARAQVDLAQMQYMLPRLRGLWTHLERQRGGVGMRGPGEKEIETDRRIVRDRISFLKEGLKDIEKQSATQRKQRGEFIRVALVGYTNAGKSTLMNALSKSDVFAENKLFATLDTTVRKVVFESLPFLLSDTVGFIRKLPHHLVESFKSTLDETRESDILLHVVDMSHPQYEDQIKAVQSTLKELGVDEKPTLIVFNKLDAYREKYFDKLLDIETQKVVEAEVLEKMTETYGDCVFISAQSKEGFEILREKLTFLIKQQYVIRFPHQTPMYG